MEPDDGFREALRAAAPHYKAPEELAGRVRALIRAEEEAAAEAAARTAATAAGSDAGARPFPGAGSSEQPAIAGSATRAGGSAPRLTSPADGQNRGGAAAHPGSRFGWPMLAMAAGIAAAVTLPLGFEWGGAHAREGQLVAEAVSAHVRSLDAGHLMDVVSTDRHTVKPWFAGKLEFAPPVIDLADAGYPLAGGRLDRMGDHAAAALVYHRRLHTINLFIWQGSEPVPAQATRDGFHLIGWSESGFEFLAVTDAAPSELEPFVKAYQGAVREAAR